MHLFNIHCIYFYEVKGMLSCLEVCFSVFFYMIENLCNLFVLFVIYLRVLWGAGGFSQGALQASSATVQVSIA